MIIDTLLNIFAKFHKNWAEINLSIEKKYKMIKWCIIFVLKYMCFSCIILFYSTFLYFMQYFFFKLDIPIRIAKLIFETCKLFLLLILHVQTFLFTCCTFCSENIFFLKNEDDQYFLFCIFMKLWVYIWQTFTFIVFVNLP